MSITSHYRFIIGVEREKKTRRWNTSHIKNLKFTHSEVLTQCY
jgi:hypothetical protein